MEVGCVTDYKKMYTSLFNDVTDAIARLQHAQQKTEDIYVSGDDGVVLERKRQIEGRIAKKE